MKAVASVEGGALSYEDYADPVAGPGEVVVELKAAAVNRRDLLVRNPPGPAYQFDAAADPRLGRRRHPARHRRGGRDLPRASAGARRQDAAGPDWRILGGPDDGTYAELVKVPAENVFPKPARFSWEEAAAFPLAALTAYRALFEVGGLVERRERADPRGGKRRLDDRPCRSPCRRACACSSRRRARRRSTARRSSGAEGGVLYTEEGWAEAVGPGRRRARLGRDDVARVAEGAPPRAAGSSSSAAPAGPR